VVKRAGWFWIFFPGWVFLTGLLSLNPHPGVNLEQGADKLAHFLFYVPFGLLGFYHPRKSYRAVLLVSLFGVNLGLILELLQRSVPGRNCEFKDFLAGALGVVAGLLLFGAGRRLRKRSSK